MNNNKLIFIVSFPRSGQHTQGLIERYTEIDDYCEFYNCFSEKMYRMPVLS